MELQKDHETNIMVHTKQVPVTKGMKLGRLSPRFLDGVRKASLKNPKFLQEKYSLEYWKTIRIYKNIHYFLKDGILYTAIGNLNMWLFLDSFEEIEDILEEEGLLENYEVVYDDDESEDGSEAVSEPISEVASEEVAKEFAEEGAKVLSEEVTQGGAKVLSEEVTQGGTERELLQVLFKGENCFIRRTKRFKSILYDGENPGLNPSDFTKMMIRNTMDFLKIPVNLKDCCLTLFNKKFEDSPEHNQLKKKIKSQIDCYSQDEHKEYKDVLHIISFFQIYIRYMVNTRKLEKLSFFTFPNIFLTYWSLWRKNSTNENDPAYDPISKSAYSSDHVNPYISIDLIKENFGIDITEYLHNIIPGFIGICIFREISKGRFTIDLLFIKQ